MIIYFYKVKQTFNSHTETRKRSSTQKTGEGREKICKDRLDLKKRKKLRLMKGAIKVTDINCEKPSVFIVLLITQPVPHSLS